MKNFNTITLLLILLAIGGCNDPAGSEPIQKETVELFDVTIEYIPPYFENSKIIWYQAVNGDTIRKETNASQLMTVSLINDTSGMWRNPLITDSTYYKRSMITVESESHAFTAAGLSIEDKFEQGHIRSDIVMWEKDINGFTPVRIYPEAIGGCLYCNLDSMILTLDTLQFSYSGRDVEDKWGGKKIAIISGDSIYVHMLGWFSQYNYIPSEGSGNPVATASHLIWNLRYYSPLGELLDKKIEFDAWYPDGRKVYLNTKSDSLDLYDPLILSPCTSCPYFLYVKTVNVDIDSVRVGPVKNFNILHIAVYWEDKWFYTLEEQIERP